MAEYENLDDWYWSTYGERNAEAIDYIQSRGKEEEYAYRTAGGQQLPNLPEKEPWEGLPETPKDPFEREAKEEIPWSREVPSWGDKPAVPAPGVPDKPSPGLEQPEGSQAQEQEAQERTGMSLAKAQDYNRTRMRGRMQPGVDPGGLDFAELVEDYQIDHGGLHRDGMFGPNTEKQVRLDRQDWLDDGSPAESSWGSIWEDEIDWSKPVNQEGSGGGVDDGGGSGGGADDGGNGGDGDGFDPPPNPDPTPDEKGSSAGLYIALAGGGFILLAGAGYAMTRKKKGKR